MPKSLSRQKRAPNNEVSRPKNFLIKNESSTSSERLTLKYSAYVTVNNTGWPISQDKVLKSEGDCKSLTVNQGINGSALTKVNFGIKNSSVVIVRCKTAADKINLDNLK